MEEHGILSRFAWKAVTIMTNPDLSWISGRLHPDDLRALEGVIVHLSGQRSITLPQLLASWKHHVEKLEADLSLPSSDRSVWGAHDLVAALVLRDFIQDGLGALDVALRSKFEILLSEIDSLFISFTEPDDLLRVEKVDARPGSEREWWWKRIPVTGPAREEVILYSGLN
ncbi:hypothetical protein [Streptomyces sp. BPTC-684]|uniref:hypothetical protein n=1 Tax=Streptomyces sp. BPTC-684 TaxID=3043734 RepID=UPI0024B263AC|nr:hypothetical protein [Streptomyces sp. BPTC-684]WHM36620.1 hypothetical protein QIY60_06475 [Streptomyces sp. BPTC-684]